MGVNEMRYPVTLLLLALAPLAFGLGDSPFVTIGPSADLGPAASSGSFAPPAGGEGEVYDVNPIRASMPGGGVPTGLPIIDDSNPM